MKKIFIKICSVVLILSLSCCFFIGCGEDNKTVLATKHRVPDEVYKLTFNSAIGEDVMPVGAYAGPHATEIEAHGKKVPSMVTEEYFNLYKDMGLNFFTSTLSDSDDLDGFLTLCDKYNMGAFATFENLYGENKAASMTSAKINSNLAKYANHKSLIGFFLRDEPSSSIFTKLNKTVTALENSDYSNSIYHYVNALPDCSATGNASWKKYLENYCEQLKPAFLSFDFYPWLINKEGTPYYKAGYIKSLSIARSVANEYKIPLWSCKQCGSIMEDMKKEHQAFTPTENEFRWQMSIDLAYGVKGFTYFLLCGDALAYDTLTDTSGNPIWEEGLDDYYGLINCYTGEPNCWYYYAKDFYKHLSLFDDILLNSYHDGIIINGYVSEQNNMGEEVIKSGGYNELLSVAGSTSIVGCYNYGGRTVLYVTNNSWTKSGTVTLNFDNCYGYDIYQGKEVTTASGESISLNLKEGEGVLVALKYE